MASDRSRKKTVISQPCDIISDLPVNIIETILICLPLRDAVRTSILSRKWRYNWVGIPQLVFDHTFCQGFQTYQQCSTNILMMAIYQVLLLHRGPMHKFTLSISKSCYVIDIDQLMHFLSRNGVEEITLQFLWWQNYKLSSSFFSCLQPRHLNLRFCVFKPPPVFNGFSRLISLNFLEVDFDDDLFGKIISNCPLLEHLSLTSCTIDSLEIVAPKLKFLDLIGSFNAIIFKNTPLLESLSIPLGLGKPGCLEHIEEGQFSKMIEVFRNLPMIEHLHVGYYFMRFLTSAGVPERLPFNLNHLKSLVFHDICFYEIVKVSFALCLIKSSPNLKEVMLEVSPGINPIVEPVLKLFEDLDNSDISVNQLREVHMLYVFGGRLELEFIKLLLAKSPMLENMFIVPHSKEDHEGSTMLQELTRFGRASPKAEIIYESTLSFNPNLI